MGISGAKFLSREVSVAYRERQKEEAASSQYSDNRSRFSGRGEEWKPSIWVNEFFQKIGTPAMPGAMER
jgi:hypothetical protein